MNRLNRFIAVLLCALTILTCFSVNVLNNRLHAESATIGNSQYYTTTTNYSKNTTHTSSMTASSGIYVFSGSDMQYVSGVSINFFNAQSHPQVNLPPGFSINTSNTYTTITMKDENSNILYQKTFTMVCTHSYYKDANGNLAGNWWQWNPTEECKLDLTTPVEKLYVYVNYTDNQRSHVCNISLSYPPSDLTIDPNGGSYDGSTEKISITNIPYETGTALSMPVREGYSFEDWELPDDGCEIKNGSIYLQPNTDTVIKAKWIPNNYAVTYIDRIKGTTTDLGSSTEFKTYGSTVAGSDKGTSTMVGAYYPGYKYDSCTSETVTILGATVYRYFVFPTASYKVYHQQEQLDGSYLTVDTEDLTGTIGTSVTPAVKNYTGFTSPETQTVTIAADGSTTVTYKYTRNSYTVTYKDVVDSTSGTVLGQSTVSKKYGSTVKGSDLGSSTADNAYYNGYYYVSDTSDTVGTSGATVYRIFNLRTLDINGSVTWIDKSNAYSSRPDNVTVYLYRDGEKIDTTTGLVNSESNEYSFKNLPKYSTSDGHVYNYTVSQSEAVSKTSPEDKYTTTQNTYDFINVLSNTDTDTDSKGLTVSGSIYWEDNGNSLGYRPSTVTITLYQNGEEYKTIEVDTFNNNTYEFIKLPKYDNELNKYEYTVEETVIANYLVKENGNYVLKDAYTVKADTPNPLDFTNVFNIPSEPPIPVKPEYTNTVTIKTNTEDKIAISLKGMETIINDDLSVSYGTSYNGQVYNVSANNVGEVLSSIGSGKYEISYYNTAYILNDITCTGDSNIWIEGNSDTYYLVIKDTNSNISGTITLNFSKKDHVGYQSDVSVSNYFKVKIETEISTALETQVFALSRVTVTAEDIYSVIYENSDTVDDNIYNEGDEVEVLNYEGKVPEGTKFIGWSLTEDVEEADYLVGDILIIENKNISLYPVFKEVEESTETETREVEETDTSETTEKSSEEETSQEETPLKESSTEGTSSMEESIVEEESSESLETQENAEANE